MDEVLQTETETEPRLQPKDIRITQMLGGYVLNKFGGKPGNFYPTEVCTSLGEVVEKVEDFFADSVASPQVDIKNLAEDEKALPPEEAVV
jgi:hypothetical protein